VASLDNQTDATHSLPGIDLGVISYADAYRVQLDHHAEVLASRDDAAAPPGVLLFLEHHPVITVTRRPDAAGHVLAPPEALAAEGIELAETDRGGDVTYHGPGQLVCYPIVDLKRLGLGLHEYIRALEAAVIDTVAHFGIIGRRDPTATGVWVPGDPDAGEPGGRVDAKICAIGVRVRRWITLHGLALNVRTNLDHFTRIVPCGLAGRPVTSMGRQLGESAPRVAQVTPVLAASLRQRLSEGAAPRTKTAGS